MTISKSLTCIDLFAGCGGLSLGLELAGFSPLLFSEINHSAASTYMANRRGQGVIPVGDVHSLTNPNIQQLITYWKNDGIGDIDLVCGGPPCQGYSGIGHRRSFDVDKQDVPSNHLFYEMVRVIEQVRPKLFLFENVRGLINSRWTKSGDKGEIFEDVLSTFDELGNYAVRWNLVHAKDYGVPQNRPRVLVVGIRQDVLAPTLWNPLACTPNRIQDAVECGMLPAGGVAPPHLEDLFSDLVDPDYLGKKETSSYPSRPITPIQRWFRTTRDRVVLRKGSPLREQEYSNHAPYIREKFQHMIDNNGEIPERFKTKKFAQRVLPAIWDDKGPNLTATSLEADYVHYCQPRTPTVREWARLQTFPDWYEFEGPRTTGGRRRAGDPSIGDWSRDVPKYTQIGNAVPVLLAKAIGEHFAALIESPEGIIKTPAPIRRHRDTKTIDFSAPRKVLSS
ncbi:DNA cytosine methyltransferase [Planctomycetota bacterium]|nr:DNA cytosine methyltransferase [Planctomycetota bacterium]